MDTGLESQAARPLLPPPRFSVLVALAGTIERERVLELLAALRAQSGGHTYEVLLADRRRDAVSRRIAAEFPEAVLLAAPERATLPALHCQALACARGELVVVTEDHCVPEPGWLDAFARALDADGAGSARVAAVGGCVRNGADGRLLDQATFLCEYLEFHPPNRPGSVARLPGMNVCYRRSVLDALDAGPLATELWETAVHPRLVAAGRTLRQTDAACVRHCKALPLGMFTAQRFAYSRYFAGRRFARRRRWVRAGAAVLALLLPLLFLARQARQVGAKPGLRLRWLAALPFLLWFWVVAAAGEMLGYLAGPGDALERLE